MEKYIYNEQNGLWYELQDDYYIPCLVLDEEETQPIGMWGRKYLRYIKEHRPVLRTNLLLSGKLNSHLAEVNNQATEMYEAYNGINRTDDNQIKAGFDTLYQAMNSMNLKQVDRLIRPVCTLCGIVKMENF